MDDVRWRSLEARELVTTLKGNSHIVYLDVEGVLLQRVGVQAVRLAQVEYGEWMWGRQRMAIKVRIRGRRRTGMVNLTAVAMSRDGICRLWLVSGISHGYALNRRKNLKYLTEH